MTPLSFKRHRFPPTIIRHCVWLYARFTLSYRDIEEMLAERGVDVSYETVRRWFLKFGPAIAANLRRSRPRPSDHWHLDEMVVTINAKRYWLWRAVDNEGEVLDFLVQPKRNTKAAKKLLITPSRATVTMLATAGSPVVYDPAQAATGNPDDHASEDLAGRRHRAVGCDRGHDPDRPGTRRRGRSCGRG